MIATVALEGRKGEMDACSNMIASRQSLCDISKRAKNLEDRAERDPSLVKFIVSQFLKWLDPRPV